MLKISALTGKGVHKLLPGAAARRSSSTTGGCRHATVNQVICRRPAGASRRRDGARVLYATQGATDPPTFTLFVNRELPADLPALPRAQLREAFDFGATPIKLRVRKRTE